MIFSFSSEISLKSIHAGGEGFERRGHSGSREGLMKDAFEVNYGKCRTQRFLGFAFTRGGLEKHDVKTSHF